MSNVKTNTECAYIHSNISVSEKGRLAFAGCDVVDMAKEFGTGLYLLDEDLIRERCRMYKRLMTKYFGGASRPVYAGKALSFKEIYRIMKSEDMCIDSVSSGELYTASAAGFPLEMAFFHGNNKTDFDIEFAIDNNVGYIVADSFEEIDRISEIALERGCEQKVLLRITPGIDPHTFAAVKTGSVDSKFGSPIETGQAEEIVAYTLKKEGINLAGLHCHIGSQIFDSKPYCDTVVIMAQFLSDLRAKYGFAPEILNLGGGFGVRYVESDPVPNYEEYIKFLSETLKCEFERHAMPIPTIIMEPGRSIVADAGMTLYTVGTVKTIKGYLSYVSIDGGMGDNPRYALYESRYTVYNASRPTDKADFECTIAGRCCESGDLIAREVSIAKPERGEILAVAVTGAYNFSMASNYNRLPRFPIVMISKKTPRLVVRRETFEDIIKLDI